MLINYILTFCEFRSILRYSGPWPIIRSQEEKKKKSQLIYGGQFGLKVLWRNVFSSSEKLGIYRINSWFKIFFLD